MKNNKGKSLIGLFFVLIIIAACGFVSWKGVDESGQGSARNIKLGLDLAGGVSITYEADEENPSAEDMNDTVYKLQTCGELQHGSRGLPGRNQPDQR